MSNTKQTYTPGPWTIEDYRSKDTKDWRSTGNIWHRPGEYAGDWTRVCSINCDNLHSESGDKIEEFEANANLIAAAPDLLEALETLLMECSAYGNPYCHTAKNKPISSAGEKWDIAEKKATAAITKAKGGVMKTIKYSKNFEKLWNELLTWNEGNDHDGNLEYAIANDYQLHAVVLWENSGGSMLNITAGIDHKAEIKEIRALCDSADIFICPDCNHHGFYIKGELNEAPECMSCLKNNMKLDEEQS